MVLTRTFIIAAVISGVAAFGAYLEQMRYDPTAEAAKTLAARQRLIYLDAVQASQRQQRCLAANPVDPSCGHLTFRDYFYAAAEYDRQNGGIYNVYNETGTRNVLILIAVISGLVATSQIRRSRRHDGHHFTTSPTDTRSPVDPSDISTEGNQTLLPRWTPGGDRSSESGASFLGLTKVMLGLVFVPILTIGIVIGIISSIDGTSAPPTSAESVEPSSSPAARPDSARAAGTPPFPGIALEHEVANYVNRYSYPPAGAGDETQLLNIGSPNAYTIAFTFYLTPLGEREYNAGRFAKDEEIRDRMRKMLCADPDRRKLLKDGAKLIADLREPHAEDVSAFLFAPAACD